MLPSCLEFIQVSQTVANFLTHLDHVCFACRLHAAGPVVEVEVTGGTTGTELSLGVGAVPGAAPSAQAANAKAGRSHNIQRVSSRNSVSFRVGRCSGQVDAVGSRTLLALRSRRVGVGER